MTYEERKSLNELINKVTPGPWLKGSWKGQCHIKSHEPMNHPGAPECKYDYELETKYPCVSTSHENQTLIGCDEEGWILSHEDAEFIAWCREGVPNLLNELDELRLTFKGIQEEIHNPYKTVKQSLDEIDKIALRVLEGDLK